MALDLSHLSPRGCELALERYGGPVLASHANAAAVFANPRNLADDVLAGVGERGGVVGLCAIPAFVGPGDPAQRLAEHHAPHRRRGRRRRGGVRGRLLRLLR